MYFVELDSAVLYFESILLSSILESDAKNAFAFTVMLLSARGIKRAIGAHPSSRQESTETAEATSFRPLWLSTGLQRIQKEHISNK